MALLSRQFDRDRDRVIARAKQEGNCCGMLLWFSDIEKQTTVADLCKTHSGACYFSTGIHPDNIDRTNKKSHEEWLEKVEELAKRSECIGILSGLITHFILFSISFKQTLITLFLISGLNLTREVGTHFAQESLLKSSCALADKLLLPVILHVNDSKSLERCIELLRADGWATEEGDDTPLEEHRKVLLHDAMTCCEGDVAIFATAVEAGFHFIIAATGLTDADDVVSAIRSNCY